MPLIQYLGNASPQDNTESINLDPNPDTGEARSIVLGARALVSGTELRNLASSFQIAVVEDTDEKDLITIPTDMPEGYDDNGYKEGESPTEAVFTAEAYPDDEGPDPVAVQSTQAATTSVSPSTAASSPAASATQVATPAPTPGGSSSSPSTSTPGASS